MPHVFAVLIAGAGIYAGYKWLSRTLADLEAAARQRERELKRGAPRGPHAPKDLGTLEYDATTGVYRPRD